MTVPEEHFEAFFGQFVETEEAAGRFQAELVERVAPHLGSEAVYFELEDAAWAMVREAVFTASNADRETLDEEWHSLWTNAQLGVSITTAAVEAVGNVYERRAKEPQTRQSVTQNTDRIVRHVYSNAFQNPWTALRNGGALRAGLNPRNRLYSPLHLILGFRHRDAPAVHQRSLRVTTDKENGQLAIHPRYPLQKSPAGEAHGCPATRARVQREAGSRAALPAFMNVIGHAAVEVIYPEKFEIAP